MRDFLTTWQVNHVSHRLSAAREEKSNIVEFVLSLARAVGELVCPEWAESVRIFRTIIYNIHLIISWTNSREGFN